MCFSHLSPSLAFRTLIPLFDDDTGLLILSGMVRMRLCYVFCRVKTLWKVWRSYIKNQRSISLVYSRSMHHVSPDVLCHRETQSLTALKCLPLSRSSHKVKLGLLLSVRFYSCAFWYLSSPFYFFLRFQWATVWRTPQHEELPWCPSWLWMSCPVKWSVYFSWQTAALCQSAIKSLVRCVYEQHYWHTNMYRRFRTYCRHVMYILASVFSCVHHCLPAFWPGVSWRPVPRHSGLDSGHVCWGVVAGGEQAGKGKISTHINPVLYKPTT